MKNPLLAILLATLLVAVLGIYLLVRSLYKTWRNSRSHANYKEGNERSESSMSNGNEAKSV